MSPEALFRLGIASGVTLEASGGDLLATPASAVSGTLLEALRSGKAELLAWLGRAACPGWRSVPPDDLPMREAGLRLTVHQRELLLDFTRRQTRGEPGDLARWLILRADQHFNAGKALRFADTAAALDLAAWQLNLAPAETIAALEAFEELSR